MVRKSAPGPVVNEYFYCICSGSFVVKDRRYKPLVCKTCSKFSHRECTRFAGNPEDFECILCKVHTLDPFNSVENFLWYGCIANTSSYFVVEATNIRKWRSSNKDVYMACIPLNKDRLQHEWPKTFQLKINNDTVHVVKEPSWEHKRRDNPIKITHAMRTGENVINISSTTYNDNEPLFLLIIFLSKQVSVDCIIDSVKRNQSVPYDDARSRIHSILNTKIGDDEIVCMDNTHKMDFNCPVTLDKISIPTRGKFCRHIQCYDLSGYLKVMERTSAFNMRWKCPECQLIVKPLDLVVDTYVEKLINDLPNAKTIELDKELNYRILMDNSSLRSSNKQQSDDDFRDKLNDPESEFNLSDNDMAATVNDTVIELDESDDQNVEVILISDDDPPAQEPKRTKTSRLKRGTSTKPRTPRPKKSEKRESKRSESRSDTYFSVEDSYTLFESGSETRKRRRKLKKPDPSQAFFSVIADSTLAECVNTFNQRTINTFNNSTPSYDRFVLNPPVITDPNENLVNSLFDAIGNKTN